MSSAIPTWLRPSSIRARLTLWYLLILGGALLAFGVFVFLAQSRALERERDAELELRAHQFAGEHMPALLGLDVAAALAEDAGASSWPVVVRRASGAAVFRSAAFPELDWRGERAAAAAARERKPFVTLSTRSGVPVRIVSAAVDRPGADDLAVQVGVSTAPLERALRRLGLGTLLFIVVTLAAASWGGGFIARRALAPVDAIVDRVRRIQDRLGDRLDVRAGSEELDHLVVTLNEMLERIEASVRSARRFAADASHELQTPLAAIRGAVEALRAQAPSADHSAVTADLLTEVERLSALVRDLRLLASAEAGRLVDRKERIDLAALAAECSEIARAMAEDRRVRVDTVVCGRPWVLGSALHLRRVVLNLAQNAIRHSAEGSRVVVHVARADGHGLLAVLDHGSGIAREDLPHIFEPFYRADPARGRDTGGTGLGLAIVEEIVRLHGGRVKVASVPSGGSTFAVYLPSAEEEVARDAPPALDHPAH
jgi:heavy metal sensor kinase